MSLSHRDQAVIWHPYTQMKTAAPPLPVVAGEGAWLLLEDGRRILDGISSWWVTVHGHAHPHIAEAIAAQAQTLEQVIFAGFTHPQAVRLAERLLAHLPAGMARVFYSDDGSTAVEVALKMAWQYWQQQAEPRSHIVALEGAYHGDTFGAMSASGRSVFTRAFEPLLFHVTHVPCPEGEERGIRSSEEAASIMAFEGEGAPSKGQVGTGGSLGLAGTLAALEAAQTQAPIAAMILEPLIQGAGGMRMYSPAALAAVVEWCRSRGILVIFDEVMTGFYRTGKLFASHHIEPQPDIICLSKGLTGGFLPLAVTACNQRVYDAFLSDDRSRMLFHGHSFTANPLGCAAANASLDLFEAAPTQAAVARIGRQHLDALQKFQALVQVENVRCMGTILAMDLKGGSGYLQDGGGKVTARLLAQGIFIRPLGNVIYLMPPYCILEQELEWVYEEMIQAIQNTTSVTE
jgi:adenosylmethionine---8-amino-7-oxononanoate aminotransferase